MKASTPARRRLADIPHMQASEVMVADVPAAHGVAAHRDYTVITACGDEVAVTLVTRYGARVRCGRCKIAMEPGA